MSNFILDFVKNDAGEAQGLGDAGIETFRVVPYASCAREAGQNSRDASDQSCSPVRMTFDLIHVKPSEFPSFDSFQCALKSCRSQLLPDDDKGSEFFTNACEVVARATIPTLVVADYNTTGLKGSSDVAGTPFHSLLKSSGVSLKSNPASGGSYGIGKNAAFAISDLQTVFYTSLTKNYDGGLEFRAQGKSVLVSHIDDAGQPRCATGYWGEPKGFNAVTKVEDVPAWMHRSEIGTSIYSLGFREVPDWAERMTCSLISNFFMAIYLNDIVFEINSGSILINRNTLEGLMDAPGIVAAAESMQMAKELSFSKQLLRCLISEHSVETIVDLKNVGQFRVRTLVEDGMPQRVGFIRNGMYITDSLRQFGQALYRFPGAKQFVALVEPVGLASGKFLKKLEDPAHTSFSSERISNEKIRKETYGLMRKLGEEIRNSIQSAAHIQTEGAIILDELGDFFSDAGLAGTESEGSVESDPESYTYDALPAGPKRSRIYQSDEGSGSGRGGGDGENSRDKTVGGRGYDGSRRGQSVASLTDVRTRIHTKNHAYSREIFFTPSVEGRLQINISATGISAPVKLLVVAVDKGEVVEGSIQIDALRGARTMIKLKFNQDYNGPVVIDAGLIFEKEVE